MKVVQELAQALDLEVLYYQIVPLLVTPALGTPSSGNLSSCSGLTVTGGGTGVSTLTTAYGTLVAGTTAKGMFKL